MSHSIDEKGGKKGQMGEGYVSQVLQDGERCIRLQEVSERCSIQRAALVWSFPVLIKTLGRRLHVGAGGRNGALGSRPGAQTKTASFKT
jgi:hypothetical protein